MKNRTCSTKAAMAAALTGLGVNIALAVLKLTAGHLCRSAALVSDGAHSVSDACASVVTIVGLVLSQRERGRTQNYDCKRYECIAALVLSIILLASGFAMAVSFAKQIFFHTAAEATSPGAPAAVVSALSVAVKLWLSALMKRRARAVGSTVLEAEATHNRSDAMSSVSSLVGIVGARLGVSLLDTIAGAVIAVFIIISGATVFLQAITGLTHGSYIRENEENPHP